MLVLVLFGPLLAMWLYLAAMLLLGAVQQAQPPANVAQTSASPPGYVSRLADLRPPRNGTAAARLAGQWAEGQDWPILGLPVSRAPGYWYPPLGPPDENFSALSFDPTDRSSVAAFLSSGEPYVQ
jgi:hypothetical protein